MKVRGRTGEAGVRLDPGDGHAERADRPQAAAARDLGRDGEAHDQDRAGHNPGQ